MLHTDQPSGSKEEKIKGVYHKWDEGHLGHILQTKYINFLSPFA